jgi:hypothetical protein
MRNKTLPASCRPWRSPEPFERGSRAASSLPACGSRSCATSPPTMMSRSGRWCARWECSSTAESWSPGREAGPSSERAEVVTGPVPANTTLTAAPGAPGGRVMAARSRRLVALDVAPDPVTARPSPAGRRLLWLLATASAGPARRTARHERGSSPAGPPRSHVVGRRRCHTDTCATKPSRLSSATSNTSGSAPPGPGTVPRPAGRAPAQPHRMPCPARLRAALPLGSPRHLATLLDGHHRAAPDPLRRLRRGPRPPGRGRHRRAGTHPGRNAATSSGAVDSDPAVRLTDDGFVVRT